jgi:hypothetical protein
MAGISGWGNVETRARNVTSSVISSVISSSSVISDVVRSWAFVGRHEEARVVERAIAADRSPVVIVSGEAGVAKTRLVRESVDRAGLRPASVARVSATRAAATLPLGALAPLLPRLDVPDAMLLPAAREALLSRAPHVVLRVWRAPRTPRRWPSTRPACWSCAARWRRRRR